MPYTNALAAEQMEFTRAAYKLTGIMKHKTELNGR